jgi:hypothetical protein
MRYTGQKNSKKFIKRRIAMNNPVITYLFVVAITLIGVVWFSVKISLYLLDKYKYKITNVWRDDKTKEQPICRTAVVGSMMAIAAMILAWIACVIHIVEFQRFLSAMF